jgi:predicted unusual protein kinase regulating ubiquinone biosynthesis (AarF/ABC1/UbiB family)
VTASVPRGRLSRLLQTARAGATAGASSVFGGRSDVLLARSADHLANLRGLGAKAGQMAGYIEGLVPESRNAVFRAAMGRLQEGTTASPPRAVRDLVEAELGRSIEQAFSEWEDSPFASASIGQVHRARLHDGKPVAVKVQHPGIEQAIEQDLKNAASAERLFAGLLPGSGMVDRLFDAVLARFREELDYQHEARNLAEFTELHRGDHGIQLPRCIADHSTRRVLTTQYFRGETLERAVRHASGFRQHYAETLWRFVTRSILHGGAFNADPHPGNYLFNKDGKVVFLDFGCVERLGEARREVAGALRLAAVQRDEAAFRVAVTEWFQARGGPHEAAVQRFMRLCFEPIFASPYRVTSAYAASVVQGVRELKSVLLSRTAATVTFPVETVLLNRLQFGLYSVLARLDVEVDYAVLDGGVILEQRPVA